jgi:hypothetical protein
VIRLEVEELTPLPVLSGGEAGKQMLSRMVGALKRPTPGEIIVVDVGGIELVTASFFREAFRAFRDYAFSALACPTVFANAIDDIIEEAEVLALQMDDVFVFAELKGNSLRRGRIVGRLEDKQRRTVELICELGEGDAKAVRDRSRDDTGVNVWNNRLAALVQKCIVLERNEGRSKFYRPIVEDLAYGK